MQYIIKTTDKNIFQDILSANIEGVTVSLRTGFTDSIVSEGVQQILSTVVISLATGVPSGVLASWLYDRYVKKDSHKTSINGEDVSNDPRKIIIIINGDVNTTNHYQGDGEAKK